MSNSSAFFSRTNATHFFLSFSRKWLKIAKKPKYELLKLQQYSIKTKQVETGIAKIQLEPPRKQKHSINHLNCNKTAITTKLAKNTVCDL